MAAEIRPIRREEAGDFTVAVATAFGHGPRAEAGVGALLEPDRTLCAADDGALVATATAFSWRLTVPGGELPAAAVSMVGVHPSHRRQGIFSELMRRLLDDARRRREPLAALWASESAIYGRFGFGIATHDARIEVERDRAALRGPPAPADVRVRLVPPADAVDELAGVYDRVRAETPGMVTRTAGWWRVHRLSDDEADRDGGAGPLFCALLSLGGAVEGYALYRFRHRWELGLARNRLSVLEAIGTSPLATRETWRFLFGVDLVERIEAELLHPDHPLASLLVEPRRLRMHVGDGLWLRLVDVPAALAGRTYGADGRLVLEVADAGLPANAGRWQLTVEGGHGQVRRAGRVAADLRLDVRELASLYLGGVAPGALRDAGLLDEMRAGAVERAGGMLRSPRAPWCPEVF